MLSHLLHRNRRFLAVQTRTVTFAMKKGIRMKSTIVINATNTSPEDIIAECAKVRETMQDLNDVSVLDVHNHTAVRSNGKI